MQRSIRKMTAAVGASTFLIIVWWLAWKVSGSQFFPSPGSVFITATELVHTGEFVTHFTATVRRILIGFCFSFVAAIFIALPMKIDGWLRDFLQIQVTVGLTIPSLAWSVVGVMLFGLRDSAAVFTVVAATLPVLITALDQGIRALDRDLLEMGRIYRLKKSQVLRSIVIPQLLPHLFGAARYGLSLSWKTAIITEMLGLGSGIGYQISYYFGLLSLKHVLAWTLVFTGTMLILEYGILQRMEARIFR